MNRSHKHACNRVTLIQQLSLGVAGGPFSQLPFALPLRCKLVAMCLFLPMLYLLSLHAGGRHHLSIVISATIYIHINYIYQDYVSFIYLSYQVKLRMTREDMWLIDQIKPELTKPTSKEIWCMVLTSYIGVIFACMTSSFYNFTYHVNLFRFMNLLCELKTLMDEAFLFNIYILYILKCVVLQAVCLERSQSNLVKKAG